VRNFARSFNSCEPAPPHWPLPAQKFDVGGYLLHSGDTWATTTGGAKRRHRKQDLAATGVK
jgi:hypothetical protein